VAKFAVEGHGQVAWGGGVHARVFHELFHAGVARGLVGITSQRLRTRVPHVVRTITVRDDLVGWVVSGRKRLCTPSDETQYAAGQVFVMARGTQWDVVNEPVAGGHYEAQLMAFALQSVERFHARFGYAPSHMRP